MQYFKVSEEEQKASSGFDYVTPEKSYEQSDMGALFESINSVGASIKRQEYERRSFDVSKYGNIEFNNNTLLELASKEDPAIGEQLMYSNIGSLQEYEQRKQYLQHFQRVNQQVADNFSTAGMIALGIPLALLDADALLINPTLAGVGKVNKFMNLQSKMSKVASHAVAGALVGAESMVVYEATTGVYNDDSVTNSALMGMLLGGSLGSFIERGSNPKPDYIDTATGKKADAAVKKADELTKAEEELTKLDKAITLEKTIEEDIARTKKNLKVTEAYDKKQTSNILQEAKQFIKENLQGERDLVKKLKSEVKELFSTTTKAEKALTKEHDNLKIKASERELATRMYDEIDGAHRRLNAKYKQLKEDAKVAGEPNKTQLKKLAAEASKELKEIRKNRAKLKKQINSFGKEELKRLNQVTKELEEVNVKKKELGVKQKELTRANDEVAKTAEEFRQFSTKVKADNIITSKASQQLLNQIFTKKEMLTKDKFKKLLGERGLLTSKIADIEADKLDIIGLRKQHKNYVDKLTKELSDLDKELAVLDRLEGSKVIKTLPTWAQKLLISPIEKLLHSDNLKVAGLASMLHSGTTHHGKVQTRTAWVIKLRHDSDLRARTLKIENNYYEAKKNGYKGSKEEFETEVSQSIYATIGKMQRDMDEGLIGSATWQQRLEHRNKSNVQREYFSDNQYIKNSVDEMLDYYEGIHAKGSKLEMENFLGSNGKAYVKRFYDENKINKLNYNGKVGREAAIDKLVDAQKAYVTSNNLPMTQDMLDDFLVKAIAAVDGSLNRTAKRQSITKDFGKPQQASTSPFKQRTIDAYDDDLKDLLEDDIFTNSGVYAMNVHGKLALQEKLGVSTGADIDKLLASTEATPKEKDRLRVVIESILGTREIAKNPFSPGQRIVKAVGTYSSLMHTMAFGVPTLTEVASIAKEFGWKSTIKHLIPSAKEMKDIYLKGSPSDKNTLELYADYGSAYFTTRANRMDIESPLEATTKIQEKLDGAVHKMAVLSGLLPITDTLKLATMTAGVDFLAKMSVKANISSADMKRLNDMGFDASDLTRIRETLKVSEDGRINNMDRKSWGDLDTQITDGLITLSERTILHPNGITLPMFMSDVNEGAWISRLVMKFMRFPVESYERMLVRGIQEADSKQLLALAGNMAMWTGILSAKDALRDEDKQQYNGEEGELKLAMDSFLYNSWTAAPVALADRVVGTLTGENLTNPYKAKLFGAPQSDVEKIQSGKFTFSLPFMNVNIGDALGGIMNNISGLDEVGEVIDNMPKTRLDFSKWKPTAEDSEQTEINKGNIMGTSDLDASVLKVRNVRNNNPGNIKDFGIEWQGMKDTTDSGGDVASGSFVMFKTPEMGVRALAKDITSKRRRGLNTIQAILEVYAPEGRENNTAAYVKAVSKEVGIGSNEQLTDANMFALAKAITSHEGGKQSLQYYTDDVIKQGLALAGYKG